MSKEAPDYFACTGVTPENRFVDIIFEPEELDRAVNVLKAGLEIGKPNLLRVWDCSTDRPEPIYIHTLIAYISDPKLETRINMEHNN